MQVKDLIKKLQAMPQNMTIAVQREGCAFFPYDVNVKFVDADGDIFDEKPKDKGAPKMTKHAVISVDGMG